MPKMYSYKLLTKFSYHFEYFSNLNQQNKCSHFSSLFFPCILFLSIFYKKCCILVYNNKIIIEGKVIILKLKTK